jgi:RNA polymerase sigma-70 factor (ECF subfamily)
LDKLKKLETVYQNIHQRIIDDCRAGSRKAQSELYRLYYRPMYGVSLRILNDSAEAEDVMQESFLSAFTKLDSYRGEVSFGAWLRRIVINRSLDALKKRKVKYEEVTDKTLTIIDEPGDMDNVDFNEINQAILNLPDNYRTVLNLYLVEGLSHDDIGNALGISNESSRVQLMRAKNKLRELLKGKEIFIQN